MTRKEIWDFKQVLSALQYAVQLVSRWCFSGSGGGFQMPCFVCTNSFCNRFALFSVAMPSPEYGAKMKTASLHRSLFSLLQEQVGTDKTPAKGCGWVGI